MFNTNDEDPSLVTSISFTPESLLGNFSDAFKFIFDSFRDPITFDPLGDVTYIQVTNDNTTGFAIDNI